MTARRKPVADEARLLNLLLKGEFAAFGKESGLSIQDLGRMMGGEDEPDDDFDFDDEDYPDDDEEDWWLRPEWLRPEWLHPDCLNACLALELGTCCRYPDNPLVRAAVDLAGMVEAALARLGRDDCPATAAELARLFRFIPGLLAQVHAILPRLNATAVAQFRCPVGRLAGALDLVCAGGCPWACGDPAVPDRRAEFEPLRPLLAECATVLRTAVAQGQGGLETSTWVGDTRCLRRHMADRRNLSTNIIDIIGNCLAADLGGNVTLPDFLVAGVPKAGTTALHTALSRHPGLFMSPIKEPKFFLTDGPPPAGGGPGDALTYREHVWQRDRYEALFEPAPPGTLRGESTPLYLYDRAALRRIRDLIPAAKLIVVLRDPVERAHSNWTHLWSAGLEPVGDFVQACAEEERRIAAGWAHFWHYTGLGRYGTQLDHAFSQFPREQVLVIRYRRLVDEPAATLRRICAFLGVETGLVTEIPRENVTSHPEQSLAHRAVSAAIRTSDGLGRMLPGGTAAAATRPLERFLQRGRRERQPLGWQQRQALLPAFEDDIKLLERLLDEDFSHWLAPRARSGGLVGARPAGQGQAKNGRRR